MDPASPSGTSTPAATVLVVDARVESRAAKVAALERAGMRACAAERGDQVLRWQGDEPDLMVVAAHLPDLDAVELARRLRTDPQTAAIPLLLGVAETSARVRALAVADAVIGEPPPPAELVAVVEALLRRRRADALQFEHRKNEAMAKLAGVLAHDFNNLLTVVVGYAKMSLEELPSSSPVAEHLEEIYRAGDECAQLARQFLVYCRRHLDGPRPLTRERHPRPESIDAQAPVPAKFRGCVLVVEDEQMVREFARSVLAAKGFTVHTAADGEEGLDIFRKNRGAIDLVLADVLMPRMDGVEFAEAVERLTPGIPVTLMSGHPSPADATLRGRLSGRTVLAKPFTHRQLLAHVGGRLAEKG